MLRDKGDSKARIRLVRWERLFDGTQANMSRQAFAAGQGCWHRSAIRRATSDLRIRRRAEKHPRLWQSRGRAGAANRARTDTEFLPKDFKSFVSANSTIAAQGTHKKLYSAARRLSSQVLPRKCQNCVELQYILDRGGRKKKRDLRAEICYS